MKILITGGCGYIGSNLIPKLLKNGHKIINLDTQWFGNYLTKHKNLKNVKFDIRNISNFSFKGVKAVIHLASIANDNDTILNPNLSWETSCLATELILKKCKEYKVKRFIYASSGSVYGVRKEKKVHEKINLTPISLYNKVKMITERIVLSYKGDMDIFIFRPATVCGYSPRMRLDVSVNALTFSALKDSKIIVHGGNQIRPNIHIDDMVEIYINSLKWSSKYAGIYNCGFENYSINEIAKKISKRTGAKIIRKKIFDIRSYRLDSSKLLKIYNPKKKIEDAIKELTYLYNHRNLKLKKS